MAYAVVLFRRLFFICFALVFINACTSQTHQGDTQVDALLWSTASAEYEIIARQIYYQAGRQLDRMLSSKSDESALLEQGDNYEKRPLAIIVDIDETILSNGPFHYQLLSEGKNFSEQAWSDWVNQARSKPVPGALEYITHAAQKGVTVFYLTNRDTTLFEPTWRNLKEVGFPLSDKNQLLMREAQKDKEEDIYPNWDKGARRAQIAAHYHVIQMIGDSLDDFMNNTEHMTPAERREASSHYLAYWGDKWFMLPNPVYGGWENAILNQGETPSTGDSTNAKYRFIRGGESQGVW